MDGQIHRVPLIDGKRGARDGAYCGYPDGVPAGWAQNFSEGVTTKWVSTGHSLSKEQMEAIREEAEQRKIERAAQLKIQHADAARDAHAEWIGHDQHTRRTPEGPELWNKGVEMAEKAAQAVGGKVIVPTFSKKEKERGLTDFNDLHQSRGLDEVRKQIGPERHQEKERGKDRSQGRERGLSI